MHCRNDRAVTFTSLTMHYAIFSLRNECLPNTQTLSVPHKLNFLKAQQNYFRLTKVSSFLTMCEQTSVRPMTSGNSCELGHTSL
jgi:hypothetical protein